MRAWPLLTLLITAPALAATGLPAAIPLPPGLSLYDGTRVEHTFDEQAFLDGAKEVKRRGHFIGTYLSRVPEGFHEPGAAAWKKWEPALKANGWKLRGQRDDWFTLVRTEGGTESWLSITLGEYQDPRVAIIETPAAPTKLTLTPPGAAVETVADDADLPYFGHFPGATLESTVVRDEPLDVTVGGVDREPHLVSRGYRMKSYTPPSTLSKLEFELSYRDALAKAGWTVLPLPAGVPEGEGVVRAHYAKGGRDLWLVAGRANDDSNTGIAVAIADLGAEDWSGVLKGECRLPLYGVTFDFDKATLKPESTPVLEKGLAALAANPTLGVEVQGHTDDVGDPAYNVKLSGARAEAVRKWFSDHGVAAARLTAKGYGMNHPIVPNDNDAARARNRRVELACRK